VTTSFPACNSYLPHPCQTMKRGHSFPPHPYRAVLSIFAIKHQLRKKKKHLRFAHPCY